MSTEKILEEFEFWWYDHKQKELRQSCAIGWGLVIWQASRAAIEVDLSTLTVTHDTDTNHEPCGNDLFYADEVKTLIESLGLKVKP